MTLPCALCNQPIRWTWTPGGNLLALSPEPVPTGTVIVVDGKAYSLRGDVQERWWSGERYGFHECKK